MELFLVGYISYIPSKRTARLYKIVSIFNNKIATLYYLKCQIVKNQIFVTITYHKAVDRNTMSMVQVLKLLTNRPMSVEFHSSFRAIDIIIPGLLDSFLFEQIFCNVRSVLYALRYLCQAQKKCWSFFSFSMFEFFVVKVS